MTTSSHSHSLKSGEEIFPYSHWLPHIKNLNEKYVHAEPYPHIVFENFLTTKAAEEALSEFPPLGSPDWISYTHLNERKFGKTDRNSFSPAIKSVIDELNSDGFIHFLSELTGIKGLFADESLEGGGLHQSGPGGFLNIHADFTVHPHHRDWHRRVNVLVYLNKDWKNTYSGHLELWDRKMQRRVRKIAPLFNRCVIFNTDEDAFHGHPRHLACPDGMTRKSVALYYFVKLNQPKALRIRPTNYKARPDDGLKRLLIHLDNAVLHFYDSIKRKIGVNDKFASTLLKLTHEITKRFNPAPKQKKKRGLSKRKRLGF